MSTQSNSQINLEALAAEILEDHAKLMSLINESKCKEAQVYGKRKRK